MSDTNATTILSAILEVQAGLPRLGQLRKTDFSAYFAMLMEINRQQSAVLSMLITFSKKVLEAKLQTIEYSGWKGILFRGTARKARQEYQEILQQETMLNQAYDAYHLKLSDATGLPVPKSWLASDKVDWNAIESEIATIRQQLDAVSQQPKHTITRQALYALDSKRYELFKQFTNGNRYLIDLKVKSIEEGLAFSPEYIQGSQASERVATNLNKIRQDLTGLLAH